MSAIYEPLNLKCSAAGGTTALILAIKKKKILFIMNESNKICISF